MKDAESSVCWLEMRGESKFGVGALLVVSNPTFVLSSSDGRARLVSSNVVVVASEEQRKDIRYIRHPFVVNSCEVCFKEAETRMICSVCRLASYCSKDCQKKAWTTHKAICKLK